MGTTRIYAVTAKAGAVALVEAGTPSSAIRHVTREQYSAEVATQAQLVELVTQGVKVEKAGD